MTPRLIAGRLHELETIKVTAVDLKPGNPHSLIIDQPYPNTILLSHFEVTELSPPDNYAALTSLRIERLEYLLAPASLQLLKREQQRWRARAELQARQQLQPLQDLLTPQQVSRLINKPERRAARLIMLDIHWKPRQPLSLTFINAGTAAIDKATIELVLYAFSTVAPITS